MNGFQLTQVQSHFEEAGCFITLNSQKFLVLILSTKSQNWMVLNTGVLDWKSSTLTTRSLRLTPSFSKCCIEKREQYSMWFNKLVQQFGCNVLVSKCYLTRFQFKVTVLYIYYSDSLCKISLKANVATDKGKRNWSSCTKLALGTS